MDGFNCCDDMSDDEVTPKSFPKRNRRSLTLAQRIDVIKRYEERATSLRRLATLFKCGRTQIKGILRKRNYFLEQWAKYQEEGGAPSNAVRQKKAALQLTATTTPNSPFLQAEQMSTILLEWMKRAKAYNITITHEIMRNIARDIADHIDCKDLKNGKQFIYWFKQKYEFAITALDVKAEPIGNITRKPLSVSCIVNDLQKEPGDCFICNPAVERGSGELNSDVKPENDGSLFISSVRSLNPSSSGDDSGMQMDDDGMMENGSQNTLSNGTEIAHEINTYKEALNYLGPLEQFALMRENVRAVGLINQLENLFFDEVGKIES